MANVNVTYQQMDDAGNKLSSAQTEIDDQLTALKSLVDQLVNDGYVTDSSSKAFSQSYEEFTTGARQVIEGLSGMAGYLHTAAQTFQEADTQLANALKS
jgi:WXG100 family type VII secretion target